jgi:RNA polymerase sigma factor (sigma-70 family)
LSDDAVAAWLNAAGRQPIPSKTEQLTLAKLIQRGQQPDATKAEQRAGRRAKDRLVAGNLRLIVPIARKFAKRIQGNALGFEDLLQAGVLGLTRAAELYDASRGYTFGTPAFWWISQSIRKAVLESDCTIRRPTSAQDLARRFRYKGEQTIAEFCEAWGLTEEKLQSELMHYHRATCTSLDQKAHQGEDSSELGDFIADPNSEYDVEQLDRQEAIRALQEALPDDLHLVEVAQSATAKELAAVVGCEPRQVARHLSSAKERLREHLEQPVAVLPRQNVVTLNDHRPVTTSSNGLQSLERLIEAPAAEAPVVQPAPAKKRTRRSRAEMQAARAAKAPEQITMEIGGVTVKASATDCVALLRGLQAA